jgi:membrane-anchored glycerophosphoryl diester phosphodiesterase (GDPDase)
MEEKVMSRLKQAVKMLRYNFSSIAFFEIVYRVLSLAILIPAMYGLLNVSMDIAGVSYLSSGTIYRYMRSPITYVTFLLILILIAFFLLINLSGIIYSMEASVRREKLNPMDILLESEMPAGVWHRRICSHLGMYCLFCHSHIR